MYRVFSSLNFTVPIFMLFLLENGLSFTQAMFLQGWYTFIVVVMQFFVGAFADRFGRKNVLFMSPVFMFFGTLTMFRGYAFFDFMLAETIMGIASGIYFGIDSAFIYDTLLELKQEKDFKKVWGNIWIINYLCWGTASLIGGFIAEHGLRLTYFYTLFPWVLAAMVPLFFKETKIHKSTENYFRLLRQGIRYVTKHPTVRFLIIFNCVIGGLTFSLFFIYAPLLESLGMVVSYIGMVYLFMYLLNASGSKSAHKLENVLGETKSLLLIILLPIISLITIYFSKYWLLVSIMMVLMAFGSGFSIVVITDYINKHVLSQNRATVMTLQGVLYNGVVAVFAPLFGVFADLWGMTTVIGIIVFLLVANLLFFVLFWERSRAVVG